MASIESVRASIDANVKTNGQQQITGGVLNSVLNKMVDLSEDAERALENKSAELNAGIESVRTDVGSVNDDVLSLNDRLGEIETDKADKDGKYPQLTAGFASNLVGRGESTESEFTFRASGGKSIEDGAARIAELRGNGVVWNQLGPNADFREGSKGWSVVSNKGTLEVTDGVANITLTTEPTASYCGYLSRKYAKTIVGHKYAMFIECKIPKATQIVLEPGASFSPRTYTSETQPINTWVRVGMICTCNQETDYGFVGFFHALNGGYTIGDSWQVRALPMYDLTLMFRAGNEPTTIEEFYARMPIGVDEYAYNEGTLIPFNADAIKSVGFNAFDKDKAEAGRIKTDGTVVSDSSFRTAIFRCLPNTAYYVQNVLINTQGYTLAYYDIDMQHIKNEGVYTSEETLIARGAVTTPSNAAYMRVVCPAGYIDSCCVNLSHTGYRNGEYHPYEDFVRAIDPRIKEAFPSGMKPWDKVYNKNGKGYVVKGIVEVDLGTLSYYVGGSTNGTPRMVSSAIPSIAVTEPTDVANIVCSKYVANTANNVYMNNIGIAVLRTGELSIYDPAYTDASAFKTAMQGVMLWCELAEPEVIEYDEPFNLDYEVWDFGTEEIISEQPSAPISADIIYQFNAVDTIRNNQIEIAQLKAMIATMQAQMASMASNEDVIE